MSTAVARANPEGEPRRIRVFLVADHPVVRAGLRTLLASEADLELVGEATTESRSLLGVQTSNPDVVVIDPDGIVNPDGRRGLELVGGLTSLVHSAKFLVLTGTRSADQDQEVLRHGARGLVLKDEPLHVLLKAIRRVDRGELWFERRLLATVIIRHGSGLLPGAPHRGAEALTDREREIVSLIGEGLRNEQIAARMGVAGKTVRNQLSSIFDKLGVNDRLGLVVYAFRHGLALPSE